MQPGRREGSQEGRAGGKVGAFQAAAGFKGSKGQCCRETKSCVTRDTHLDTSASVVLSDIQPPGRENPSKGETLALTMPHPSFPMEKLRVKGGCAFI